MVQFKSVGHDFAHPCSRTMDCTTVDFKQNEGFWVGFWCYFGHEL